MIVALSKGWTLHQLDINNALIDMTLTKDVYMSQPQQFEDASFLHFIYNLQKAIYGLKQAPCTWFDTLKATLVGFRFVQSKVEIFLLFQIASSMVYKQASHAWFDTLKAVLVGFGFVQSKANTSLVFRIASSMVYLLIYMDGINLIGNDNIEIQLVISLLHDKFALKCLGLLKFFLGY